MKIPSSNQIHSQDPLQRKPETQGIEPSSTQGRKNTEVNNTLQGDRIEISGQAQGILQASEIVRTTPEIRASKVEEVKRAVDQGIYRVDSNKVAGRMLDQIREELLEM
ncbi:MAG: flagellar biosynthesis anti-sigma factor FlgM [Deltaproteobacteria bacterium]|nr:flagellar biosynthesis anti-sigma factor FlgM [Deltaproteobacteria bacterium]